MLLSSIVVNNITVFELNRYYLEDLIDFYIVHDALKLMVENQYGLIPIILDRLKTKDDILEVKLILDNNITINYIGSNTGEYYKYTTKDGMVVQNIELVYEIIQLQYKLPSRITMEERDFINSILNKYPPYSKTTLISEGYVDIGAGTPLPIASMGDGYRSVIKYLSKCYSLLQRGNNNTVLLLLAPFDTNCGLESNLSKLIKKAIQELGVNFLYLNPGYYPF